ncbi:MAG: hypothetical protein Q7J79_04640 [Gemmatimonadales bacterium]|nr:hypothetical protein [Gemmatimonadales bacterium]
MRRELLFAEGEPCDPRRLAETERLLRAQTYLRSARVTTTPAQDGGVDVAVETRDDWALRIAVRLESGNSVRRFRLSEENFLGRGIRVQFRYNNFGRRTGFDVGVLHRQLFGRHDAELVAGKSSVGSVAEQSVLRPFESEFDRLAWRESNRYRKEPFPLVSPTLGTVAQPLVSVGGDVGIAARFGVPGRLRILGAVLSTERLYKEGSPLAPLAADDSLAQAALAGRYTERRRVRVHLILGWRSLRFTSHSGVDGVNAVEDIREGVEAGVVLGRSLFGSGGLQHDWFVAAEMYLGAALNYRTLVFLRGKAEGRYLTNGDRWDGVIASGEVLVYYAVSERGVMVLGLRGGGGWHTSTPFQLLLSSGNGIRGYGYTGLPVGRRVVVQVEHRYFVGTAFGAVDVGSVGFVDLGQGWAGDAAFGENTGLVASIGAGLRLAFPSGSRLTYRLDLAMPITRGAGPELRFGLQHQFGILRGESDDVTRSREQVSSVNVFNFPRY